MTEHDTIEETADESETAQVERRLGQAFDFIQEIIDNPDLLDELEDGSTVVLPARRPSVFYSFRQAEQAIDALRFLADLLERAPADPYLWKWVALAMHDAFQGFMGLALRGSHGAQLLVPKHEQRQYQTWAEERRLGRASPTRPPRQVDSFLNLYKKIQEPERMVRYVYSHAFVPTPAQDEAIRALDSYRKELTHYGDSTLMTTVGWFPTMILEVLSAIEWLVEESRTVVIFPEDQDRAREMIRLVREKATPLAETFALAFENPPASEPT
jgi:hypothetical protein